MAVSDTFPIPPVSDVSDATRELWRRRAETDARDAAFSAEIAAVVAEGKRRSLARQVAAYGAGQARARRGKP